MKLMLVYPVNVNKFSSSVNQMSSCMSTACGSCGANVLTWIGCYEIWQTCHIISNISQETPIN